MNKTLYRQLLPDNEWTRTDEHYLLFTKHMLLLSSVHYMFLFKTFESKSSLLVLVHLNLAEIQWKIFSKKWTVISDGMTHCVNQTLQFHIFCFVTQRKF